MIKLSLLIPTLDRSGAEKQLTLLARGLPRDEFEVNVIALTRGGPYADVLNRDGVPVTVIGKRFKLDPTAILKLRNVLREQSPDVLHTWLFAANSYGRIVAGKHPPFPIVVSERCVDVWKSGWQLSVDRWLAPRTTRLIGNSEGVVDFYRCLPLPEERLLVIPNGVEPVSFPAAGRDHLRQELNIPPQVPVIAYVGRLARQKRVKDLIWAFELVRALETDARFLIIGDGPERERLEDFVRQIRLTERVQFLGHREDASQLLAVADVFWLASDFEGQSNSLLEAMAAGIPTIASDIPPNRELVVEGQTGTLVPVGDRAAFAKAAERLLLDRELRQRWGAAGRERIAREFSVSKMVAAYAQVYRDIVAADRARRACTATAVLPFEARPVVTQPLLPRTSARDDFAAQEPA